MRLPAAKGCDCRIELRSPDPAANPYYLIALLLAAGFEGVREKLPLEACAAGSAETESVRHLPETLGQALDIAAGSEFLHRVLPERLLARYLAAKRAEYAAYETSGNRHSTRRITTSIAFDPRPFWDEKGESEVYAWRMF